MTELPEIVACMPRMTGGWQHFASLLAFVFLAWAFRSSTNPRWARAAPDSGIAGPQA
jgi:hypothetical protein